MLGPKLIAGKGMRPLAWPRLTRSPQEWGQGLLQGVTYIPEQNQSSLKEERRKWQLRNLKEDVQESQCM